jgi:hypothetical protein
MVVADQLVLAALQNLAMAKLAGGWHMHGMTCACPIAECHAWHDVCTSSNC